MKRIFDVIMSVVGLTVLSPLLLVTSLLIMLDSPGGGCHPIMIDASIIQETQDGLILNTAGLLQYEDLFRKVAAH